MDDTLLNAPTRTATDLMQDMRNSAQKRFVHQVCDDMLDGVRAYPRVPGELPEHDIVMTSEGPDAMLERFRREPDMLAAFLPEGYAVVDRALLEKFMKTLADAIPLAALVGGKSLGPVSGKDYAEMVLRMSADKLYGASEHARRQHEDEQRR